MTKSPGRIRLALRVGVFAVAFYGFAYVSTPLLIWLAGYLAGVTFGTLFGAVFATWLCLRIYEDAPITAVGLWWNGSARNNLLFGLAGGIGAACLAVGPLFLTGGAKIVRYEPTSGGGIVVGLFCLSAGAIGEEMAFRGYGFQLLLSKLGAWAAIIPVGIAFGLMHAANPDSSRFGIVNTAGFGIAFGYAYLRSRDLWLPIGLHLGWNCALPAFGANLSGLKIFREILGYEAVWKTDSIWSGGAYGPEASVLTSASLVILGVYLWKAPIRRQMSPIVDRPTPELPPEAPPLQPSF
jgi:uncharacterized protein